MMAGPQTLCAVRCAHLKPGRGSQSTLLRSPHTTTEPHPERHAVRRSSGRRKTAAKTAVFAVAWKEASGVRRIVSAGRPGMPAARLLLERLPGCGRRGGHVHGRVRSAERVAELLGLAGE